MVTIIAIATLFHLFYQLVYRYRGETAAFLICTQSRIIPKLLAIW